MPDNINPDCWLSIPIRDHSWPSIIQAGCFACRLFRIFVTDVTEWNIEGIIEGIISIICSCLSILPLELAFYSFPHGGMRNGRVAQGYVPALKSQSQYFMPCEMTWGTLASVSMATYCDLFQLWTYKPATLGDSYLYCWEGEIREYWSARCWKFSLNTYIYAFESHKW